MTPGSHIPRDHTMPGSHTQGCRPPMPRPFPAGVKTHPNQMLPLRAGIPGWEAEGWQNCRPAILLLAWDAVPETIAPLSCRRWSEVQLLHQRGEGYSPQQENHIFHSNLLHLPSPTTTDPVLIPGRQSQGSRDVVCREGSGRGSRARTERLLAPQLGG